MKELFYELFFFRGIGTMKQIRQLVCLGLILQANLFSIAPAAPFAAIFVGTAASLKAAQWWGKKDSQNRIKKRLELIDAFGDKNWQVWRQYPYAAQCVKELFEDRGKKPKDFSFNLGAEVVKSY